MKYPLEQLAIIKKKRLEEAERTLKEKKEALVKEEKRLLEVSNERDTVLKHRNEKIAQLDEELFGGTTSDKIQIAERYIKRVDEELKKKEKVVIDQKGQVEKAKQEVEVARKNLLKKQQDVEKISLHKEEWDKEMRQLEIEEEGRQGDELGSAMHILHKKRKKKNG